MVNAGVAFNMKKFFFIIFKEREITLKSFNKIISFHFLCMCKEQSVFALL